MEEKDAKEVVGGRNREAGFKGGGGIGERGGGGDGGGKGGGEKAEE